MDTINERELVPVRILPPKKQEVETPRPVKELPENWEQRVEIPKRWRT